MRWTAMALALAVLAASVWWWSGRDERRVRARLDEAAAAVGAVPGESEIARVTRAATLARSVASDIELVSPEGAIVNGRDAVIGAASRLASSTPFTVELADVEVAFDDVGRAVVTATALVTGGGVDPHGVNGEEFRFELRSEGGEWLISRAEAVAALERPE